LQRQWEPLERIPQKDFAGPTTLLVVKLKYPHCPISMRVFVYLLFLTPCFADTKATWLETFAPVSWPAGVWPADGKENKPMVSLIPPETAKNPAMHVNNMSDKCLS
jgi:hypothetical protein